MAEKSKNESVTTVAKSKINWEDVIKDKYSYDINLITIINRFVSQNKNPYDKVFHDVLCFVEKTAERDNRYYIDFEEILNNLMLGVILSNDI